MKRSSKASKADPPAKSATYAGSGVDIGAARRAIDLFRKQVESTFRSEVVGGVGGFGGAFAFDSASYKDPLLVSGTDGVGTKVMIAQTAGVHDTIGIDLVAMSVNDVAAHGAEPLFFLDYIVTEKVDPEVIEQIVKGVAAGCRRAGCALLGGEIAEHPGHFPEGGYDLAGFCVGAVDREALVTGEAIRPGDVVLGLASSGLHSNGYSLVREVLLKQMSLKLEDRPLELDCKLGEELLKPTTIYSPVVTALVQERLPHGIAHITGGGMYENIARVLPEACTAAIDGSSWTPPGIFELIRRMGRVEQEEMFSTFNMGIGLVVVVDAAAANHALDVIRASGYTVAEIGEIAPRQNGLPPVVIR